MGCTSEQEVIKIKLNKRLLLTTAAGVAIIMSAVLLVSMGGNDKPIVTTNPPEDNDQQPPASNADLPAANVIVPPNGNDTDDGDDEQGPDDEKGPGHNGNGNGPSDAPKKRGLERAIEVHEKNIAKKIAKGNVNVLEHMNDAKGLTHSLENLKLNLEKHGDNNVQENGSSGHGLAKGHANT